MLCSCRKEMQSCLHADAKDLFYKVRKRHENHRRRLLQTLLVFGVSPALILEHMSVLERPDSVARVITLNQLVVHCRMLLNAIR